MDKFNFDTAYLFITNYHPTSLPKTNIKKTVNERKVEKNTATFASFLQKSMDKYNQ